MQEYVGATLRVNLEIDTIACLRLVIGLSVVFVFINTKLIDIKLSNPILLQRCMIRHGTVTILCSSD